MPNNTKKSLNRHEMTQVSCSAEEIEGIWKIFDISQHLYENSFPPLNDFAAEDGEKIISCYCFSMEFHLTYQYKNALVFPRTSYMYNVQNKPTRHVILYAQWFFSAWKQQQQKIPQIKMPLERQESPYVDDNMKVNK